MKKLFTILLTLAMVCLLCGVTTAEEVTSYDLSKPDDSEELHTTGTSTDVTYTVGEVSLIYIPTDIKFSTNQHNVLNNITVSKSVIRNGQYLNIYVSSDNHWDMFYVISGDPVIYDYDQYIDYSMKYDSNHDGDIDGQDTVEIKRDSNVNRISDSTDHDSYKATKHDHQHQILSLASGVSSYRHAISFSMIQDQSRIDKAGEYHDSVVFSFVIAATPDTLIAVSDMPDWM